MTKHGRHRYWFVNTILLEAQDGTRRWIWLAHRKLTGRFVAAVVNEPPNEPHHLDETEATAWMRAQVPSR